MEALGTIGTFLAKNAGKIVPGALAGGGFLSNLLESRRVHSRQQFIEDLIKDPRKFNAYVKSFEQPLNEGLVQSVGNQTQAYLGERGLSQSPTITQDVLAQALGPYINQNKQNAVSEAENNLGILGGIPSAQPTDISGALQLLFGGKPSGASSSGPTVFPSEVPNIPGVTDIGITSSLPDIFAGTGGIPDLSPDVFTTTDFTNLLGAPTG